MGESAVIMGITSFDASRLIPFVIAVVIAYSVSKIVNYLIKTIAKKIAGKTKTILDDLLIEAIDKPLTIGLTGLSIYIAAAFSGIDTLPIFQLSAKEFIIAFAAYTFYNVFCAFLRWYVVEIAPARNPGIADMESTIKRIALISIISITLVMLMNAAGIEVSPLLASLGIAGLAVALAFQDTLSNFFAGIYISIDRPIKEKDYILLETGHEGYVEKIGWRSTRIRLITNNIVIVPNSKLATSIITNFYAPDKTLLVAVPCSVSYDSDLQKVEDVTLGTIKEMQGKHIGISKDKPFIWYGSFGESGIHFNIYLTVMEYNDKFTVTHQLIKELHANFKKKGIEIPYPKRDVYLKGFEASHGLNMKSGLKEAPVFRKAKPKI